MNQRVMFGFPERGRNERKARRMHSGCCYTRDKMEGFKIHEYWRGLKHDLSRLGNIGKWSRNNFSRKIIR